MWSFFFCIKYNALDSTKTHMSKVVGMATRTQKKLLEDMFPTASLVSYMLLREFAEYRMQFFLLLFSFSFSIVVFHCFSNAVVTAIQRFIYQLHH